jgi:lipopolysaccharide transport system ATP-binding protein
MNLNNQPAISVRHLSKKYYLGTENYNIVGEALSHVFTYPVRKLLGKNCQQSGRKNQVVWALQDINFNIIRGERVGLIGKNGAGKSTLLKILSRLVYPTTGEAVIRGRVTSLLEVGTGFNPNLSGRDNIYLNASLHGLQRQEIDEIFDDIVRFSEIEKFIDTPVRYYSSGMYMRLAFAVAAHLDPDILLLDEVLAVGDMSFQQKCLQRVDGLTSEGRTVLFVSHSMDAVTRFCDRCIWLEYGQIVADGAVEEVVGAYVEKVMRVQSHTGELAEIDAESQPLETASPSNPINSDSSQENGTKTLNSLNNRDDVRLVNAEIIDENNKSVSVVRMNRTVGVKMTYEILNADRLLVPAIALLTSEDQVIFWSVDAELDNLEVRKKIGRHVSVVWIPAHFLNHGQYFVTLAMVSPNTNPLERHFFREKALSFYSAEAEGNATNARGLMPREFPGCIRPKLEWKINYSEDNL